MSRLSWAVTIFSQGKPRDFLRAPSIVKVTTKYPLVVSGSPKLCQPDGETNRNKNGNMIKSKLFKPALCCSGIPGVF